MRVFCRSDLLQCLQDASFRLLEEFHYGVPRFGIVTMLGENWALPMVARRTRRSPQKWLRDQIKALVPGRARRATESANAAPSPKDNAATKKRSNAML